MSIKKLFDSTDKTREYVAETNERDAFDSIESSRNLEQIKSKQNYYTPHIDYSKPSKFAKFGSAYLYYKGAMTRILDYYPYDGSGAEINKFYNGCLDIEKYILKNLYPRTTGYITLNNSGYGSSTPTIVDGYGTPTAEHLEYITFHGGPGTGSMRGASLVDLSPNEYNDKFRHSNIYDENIYQTDGLPDDYGKGTRTSNLRADFDDGVTVEFWLKTGSLGETITGKQVVFDWWNNKSSIDPEYGRILIELTGNTLQPFVVTVSSGSTTNRSSVSLGASSLHASMGDWHHYAISLKKSQLPSSAIAAELYVDGHISDHSNIGDLYDLTKPVKAAAPIPTEGYAYHSTASLQGWWRLNADVSSGAPDSSVHKRDGTGAFMPTLNTSQTPSQYVAAASNTFDGVNDRVNIGTSAVWNPVIGNAPGSTKKMTLMVWVRKTGDGESSYGRIIDFGMNDIGILTTPTNELKFRTKFTEGSTNHSLHWKTSASAIASDTWTHITITYDADSPLNDPKLYLNGVLQSDSDFSFSSGDSGDRVGVYHGITGYGGFIGNWSDGTREFEGQICDVAVWNSILATDEIKALYYAGTNSLANGLRLPAHSAIGNLNPREAMGRLGALLHPPAGTSAGAGSGKLSASLDEFRFWKTARTPSQIGQYWFDQVRGGTNSDISNTTLGVYYKFNEGIVGKTKYDRIVLDYSGRVTNGFWSGYTSTSRNTASAIVEASASTSEYLDPIIHSEHPRVISLRKSLLKSGSFHDTNNNSSFLSLMPGWIVDEEEPDTPSDLQNICHIAGAYFDKLYLQIAEIPKLKQLSYLSSAYDPFPYAEHLPQSLGLYSPQLFVDATVMENFINRSENLKFEDELHKVKNLIYTNLYNNLTHIFKSKGTERAIKNVFRTFNIDDRILRLSINTNNHEYLLKNNFQQTLVKESCLNLNNSNNIEGVVYQRVDSSNPESTGHISGSAGLAGVVRPSLGASTGYEDPYGATIEANIIFPNYSPGSTNFARNYTNVSLFGMHSVDTGSAASMEGTNTQFVEDDRANFQVYAVKENNKSKNVYFKLTSSYSPYPIPVLTSSLFLNTYDNEQWNISVRLKPSNYPLADLVSGSSDYTYDLIFHGINMLDATEQNSFTLTASITKDAGRHFLNASKRIYAGAERTNITGALLAKSDVLISSVRYWSKYLEDYSLLQHAVDIDNIGISGSYEHMSATDPLNKNTSMKNANALWLDWKFNQITSSNETGNFYVQDFSSGSAFLRNNYGWLGKLGGYQHTGYGYGFPASSDTVKTKRHVNTYRLISPEQSVGSDMVNIMNSDDRLYMRGISEIPNYIYSIEKSLSNAISEEMLDFMAGIVDFHHLIGAPVNRYRHRYKEMEKLRQIFFQRVSTVATVEKYMEYYKWFDDALISIVSQLVPASSEFVDDVLNVVESHVLERNKYKSVFPTLKYYSDDAAYFVMGHEFMMYPWHVAHSPPPESPRNTNIKCRFWKERAIRSAAEITSGDATVDAQREKFKTVIYSSPRLTSSATIFSTPAGVAYEGRVFETQAFASLTKVKVPNLFQNRSGSQIHGGPNFEPSKNLEYARSALYPAGPVSREGGTYTPENVLVAFAKDIVTESTCGESELPAEKIKKQKKVFKIQHGRDWQDGLGYSNVKSTYGFPFNIMSSSVKTGYNKDVVNRVASGIEITNLHHDVYGHTKEKPLQGPFTEYAVGGLQSRHVPINEGADTALTRPEAWKIVLGTCASTTAMSGAIGMVGADYPPPNYTPPAGKSAYPYPLFQKAVYYRDMVAKRPVNFKNILTKTGSTILGNYQHNYDVIQSFNAYANPRKFIDQQPELPGVAFTLPTNQTTQIRTLLDIRRGAESHFEFVPDYSLSYLDGKTNESIITTRYRCHSGIETSTRGYQDFKASEYSVYSTINNTALMLKRPWQNMSGNLVSEPAGGTPSTMRSYDQLGEDHGLYFLKSTHTARFGRWPYSGEIPGASYTQKPNWHKVHRNNVQRVEVKSIDWVVPNLNTGIVNQRAIQFGTGSYTPLIKMGKLYHSGTFTKNNDLITGSTWTLSTWLRYRTPTTTNISAILTLGDNGLNTLNDCVLAWYLDSSKKMKLFAQGTDGVGNTKGQWVGDTALSADTWYHLAVTYDGSSTSNAPIFYINGSAIANQTSPSPTSPSAVLASVNSVGSGKSYIAGTNRGESAGDFKPHKNLDLDEMAIYDSVLTAGDINTLYSNKGILNLTSSLAPETGSLVTWLRFGDVAGDPTSDIEGATNSIYALTGGYGAIFYDQMGNNNYTMYGESQTTPSKMSFITAGSAAGNPINIAFVSGNAQEQIIYKTGSVYDNLNITHPIPRSDRQYAWLSRSILNAQDMKYAGFERMNGDLRGLRSSSVGYVAFYEFVSASDELGTAPLGGGFQPVSRLNTIALDAVNTSSNTLGFPAGGAADYINQTLNNIANIPSASYLNLLLAHRGDYYGWTWRSSRRNENPIITKELKSNKLSLAVSGTSDVIAHYDLPPVSWRARNPLVNFNSVPASGLYVLPGRPNNVTLKTTHDLETIYFNQREATSLLRNPTANPVTPYNMLIKGLRTVPSRFQLVWVLYPQNIFPSSRNENLSHSVSRVGYENNFWRDSQSERLTYNAGPMLAFSMSWDGKPLYVRGSSFGRQGLVGGGDIPGPPYYPEYANFLNKSPVQSSWPLDAPADFLTRSGPPVIEYGVGIGSLPCVEASVKSAARLNRAGELQNTYFSYATSSTYCGEVNDGYRWWSRAINMSIGGLYARKQMLNSPESVVSPTGIKISQTGSYHDQGDVIPIGVTDAMERYAGEAVWEAPSQAGRIIQTTDSAGDSRWESNPSQPWYNNYTDFRADLKLLAKGYSILPEFRISEHIEDYLKYGISNPGKMNTFDIPGTNYNSTTQSFYRDFSNSEFMQGFLGTKATTMLNAKQIRLVCSAAIKFNPYEGFYPAQRTLQLISQFSRSYNRQIDIVIAQNGNNAIMSETYEDTLYAGGAYRPIMTTLYSPGILYNSIKSGIAVDYPVVFDGDRTQKYGFGNLSQLDDDWEFIYDANTYNIWPKSNSSASWALLPQINSAGTEIERYTYTDTYWDTRVPFEAIINPEKYIDGMSFADLEAHPYMTLNVTNSFVAGGDMSYVHMASNFFGEVGNFFLKDRNFTRLESQPMVTDMTFPSGSVYGARVKLRRSMKGQRSYYREYGFQVDSSDNSRPNIYGENRGIHYPYAPLGGRPFIVTDPVNDQYTGRWVETSGAHYPLPQDPQWNLGYQETFTMYSRTTAFGPPISGRSGLSGVSGRTLAQSKKMGYMDSFNGFNWAFTPPYYHGESWADLVFRPKSGKKYALEDIMAETKAVYWRVDPGPLSGSGSPDYRTLIYGGNMSTLPNSPAIYGGDCINKNAMQLSASLNLFGIERILAASVDKFGNTGGYGANTTAKKWVIQPKFETPMLNFTNLTGTIHPIREDAGTLTLPTGYGSGSVPRGMWHQFGHIPNDPATGIFMEIGDIPKNWLRYHYDVINNPSVYNNYNVSGSSRFDVYNQMRSLADVAGFNRTSTSKRLGELADKQVIHEAVVAIPYYADTNAAPDESLTSATRYKNKKFLAINPERAKAALPSEAGFTVGDTLDTAGYSIRKLVEKMQKYVLPPECDWLHNPKISPFAMLFFEFKYELDRDDLSYIWQNLAPRDYKKVEFTSYSTTVDLLNKELLQESDIINIDKVRWMVFKVKQRAQTDYYDLIAEQYGESTSVIPESEVGKEKERNYPIAYNWPYDYLSIVELVKIDAEVLFKK